MVVKDEQRRLLTQARPDLSDAPLYQNTGCNDILSGLRISDNCLRCPLSACKYDDPGPLREWRDARRLSDWMDEDQVEGARPLVVRQYSRKEVQALAIRNQVAERTMWRRIKRLKSQKDYQLTFSFALDLPDSDPD